MVFNDELLNLSFNKQILHVIMTHLINIQQILY